MKSNSVISVIVVAAIAIMLAGEVYIYTFDTDRYSSDAVATDDGIQYSVTSGGSDIYSVLLLDNGSFQPNEEYYIFYDADYGSNVEKVRVPVGAKAFTQDYYISQLVHMLDYRGISDVKILNAEDLRTSMSADIASGDFSKGLIVLSGALPDVIYKGEETDIIFSWLDFGGSLYWAGNYLGAFYYDPGNVIPVSSDYQTLFFGADCLNDSDIDKAYSDITDNDYRHTLSLMNNDLRYGVDVSKLIDRKYLAVGYAEENYSSIVMLEFGKGMICVLAGDYSNNQRHDLAQMISSGICFSSATDTEGYAEGNIKRSTVSNTLDVSLIPNNNYIVYIYYGGYYPVYGKTTAMIV